MRKVYPVFTRVRSWPTSAMRAWFKHPRYQPAGQVVFSQPFLTALADLTEWLAAAGVPAMIVGGIAASILGRPRATRDIDTLAVVPDDQWTRLVGSAETHGILPRIE